MVAFTHVALHVAALVKRCFLLAQRNNAQYSVWTPPCTLSSNASRSTATPSNVWTVLYCANALHWLNSKQHRRCFVPAYDLNRLAIWNSLTFYHQMRQSLAWPMQEIMIHTANVILFSWFCAPYKDHYSNLSFRTFCLIYILTGILFEHVVMAKQLRRPGTNSHMICFSYFFSISSALVSICQLLLHDYDYGWNKHTS